MKRDASKAKASGRNWQPVIDVIESGKDFLVAGHRYPDGDAVGSATALYGMLKKLGKNVVLLNDMPYPSPLEFLPFSDKMQQTLPLSSRFDASFLCDTGCIDRAPKGFPTDPILRGKFIIIDHHQTSKEEGDLCYNDPSAAAVGLLIYELGKALGVDLDVDIATCLYTSILADTGSFRYDKTDPYVMEVGAELLRQGVSPWSVSSSLYESAPLERQRLLARALDTITLSKDGRLAMMFITSDMLSLTGATAGMTDGFINFARGIKGVEAAVMFREQERGWKLSFRSRGTINVADIASRMGGGGHKNAAGAFVGGSLEHAQKVVFDHFEQFIRTAKFPKS